MKKKLLLAALGSASILLLAGCNSNEDSGNTGQSVLKTVEYQVTITNVTGAQPFSKGVAVLSANAALHPLWQLATKASQGIEKIAEGGDNSEYNNQPGAVLYKSDFIDTSTPALNGILEPWQSETFTISLKTNDPSHVYLSTAQMLGVTNDGFAGFDNLPIGQIGVNQSQHFMAMAYDAGTEDNAESKETVPGLMEPNTGYNKERGTGPDFITIHPGVTSNTVGGTPSADYELKYRFDPSRVAEYTIKRIQ